MSTAESSRDGVWVRKAFDADRFSEPVIVFRIESLRDDPVTVTVSDPVPTAVPADAIKFHPEFDAESWRATGDQTVEFEHRLAAGETVTTLYAAAVDPETARRNLMDAPTIASVLSGSAARPPGETTAGDAAADGDRGGRADTADQPGADRQRGTRRDGSRSAAGSANAPPDDGTDPGGRGRTTSPSDRRNATGADARSAGGPENEPARRGGAARSRPGDAARRGERRTARRQPETAGRGVAARYGTPQSLPLAGAVAGAAAFLLGFLGTYLVAGDALDDTMSAGDLLFVQNPSSEGGIEPAYLDGLGIDPPGTTRLVAWLYHDLHAVDLGGTFSVEGGGRAVSYGVAMEYGPDAVLYALPPLALAVGGFLAVRYLGYRAEKRAVKAGMSVGVGYATLSVASAVLLAWEATATRAGGEPVTYAVEFGADPVSAALVAGLLYPALFGATGGYVAARTA